VNAYGGSIRAYNDDGACFEFTMKRPDKNTTRDRRYGPTALLDPMVARVHHGIKAKLRINTVGTLPGQELL
jgi:hypothetical protein